MVNDIPSTPARPSTSAQEYRLSDAEVNARQAAWINCLNEFHDHCRISDAIDDISAKTIDAITAYLAGELAPEGCALIEQMLRQFPGFRLVYADLIAAWQMPSAEREVTPPEVDAAYLRFRMRAGLGGKRRS